MLIALCAHVIHILCTIPLCRRFRSHLLQMLLQLQTITDEREQHMDRLWREFQAVLADYLQHTEQFHDEYLVLRQRDDEDTKIIRFHYAEVLRTTNLIAELKHRLDTHQTDHRVHVVELQRYKRLLQDRQADRKATMEEGCRGDRENLRWMVVQSDAAITVMDLVWRTSWHVQMNWFFSLFDRLCAL